VTAELRALGARPEAARVVVPPATGAWGFNPRKNFEIIDAKCCILVNFWVTNAYEIKCKK
jgi:hypothetical protein